MATIAPSAPPAAPLDAHVDSDAPFELAFAKAWTAQWHDLGCFLIVDPHDGSRRHYQPEPHVITNRHTGPLPPHLQLYTEEEAKGAAKALLTLLRLTGEHSIDAVFALADARKEG